MATTTIKPSGQGGDYLTLAAWEAGQEGTLSAPELAQIDGDWTGVTDTTAVTIAGTWVTSAANYISIYTTGTARHDGIYGNKATAYKIEVSGTVITVDVPYVRIDGLQVYMSSSSVFRAGILFTADADGNASYATNNIIKGVSSSGATGYRAGIGITNVGTGTYYFYNNIIYDFDDTGSPSANNEPSGIWCNDGGATIYAYFNTVYNCYHGYRVVGGSWAVRNSMTQATTSNGFIGTFGSWSDFNISDKADTPGNHGQDSASVTFVAAGSDNFHVSSSDTVAIRGAMNTWSDPYLDVTTDIDGNARKHIQTVGADHVNVSPALSAYTYSKSILLDTTANAAAVTTDQTSFPVAVHINSSSWPTAAELERVLDPANTAGKFLNFYTNADQTYPLDYEVEYFASDTEAVYWVRIPTVKGNYEEGSGTLNTLYVGYEASSGWPTRNQDCPYSVWDANTMMVQHLGDNSWGSSPEAKDSTINANNGTNSGSTDATGQVRKGRSFVTDDYISAANAASLRITGSLTLSVWAKTNAISTYQSIIAKGSGVEEYLLGIYDSKAFIQINAAYTDAGNTIPDTNLHYIVGTYDSINMRIYLDTVLGQTKASSVPITNNYVLSIGRFFGDGTGGYWDGDIDEVRISNSARSADWIKLEYYSMKKTNYNGDTGVSGTGYPFVSWGAEQGGVSYLSINVHDCVDYTESLS